MKASHVFSLLLHAALAAVLLLWPVFQDVPKPVAKVTRFSPARELKPLFASGNPKAGGGSGQHDMLPPTKGPVPPRATFTIPPIALDRQPKLAMSAVIELPPDVPVPVVAAANFGDPFSIVTGPYSGGRGKGGMPGDGEGGVPGPGRGSKGFGPGDEAGVFGPGSRGGQTRAPEVIYRVDPEFSDEARKARYQGMVVLMIDIAPDGRPSNFRVMQGLGMGLDEKAIEAVGRWRFRPAMMNGKPVTAAAQVMVNFRLL